MSISDGHYLFTSESVTEGHPDKVADQISDAVLDAIIAKDPNCHVACETLVTTGLAVVAGEITTNAYVHIPALVRATIREIGYCDAKMGFDYNTCAVVTSIDEQSPDIARGVNTSQGQDQGAGDQGLMFGYACNETQQFMPMPIHFAHKLTRRLATARREKALDFLRPDGKSQVTVEYARDGKPLRIEAVVVSSQHEDNVAYERIREGIIQEIIKKELPPEMLDKNTKYYVNPTGRFVIGGPQGDCGLTGRKIIVDTYGGMGAHGGGAFSGKDPSKVDRSASYMARYIAKNIVASGVCSRCEVQLSYAIGVAQPVSIMVNTFGTSRVDDFRIAARVRDAFDLRPAAIIKKLDLLRPIYKRTAAYGHFGRFEPEFTWEKTDMQQPFKELQ